MSQVATGNVYQPPSWDQATRAKFSRPPLTGRSFPVIISVTDISMTDASVRDIKNTSNDRK